MFCVMEYGENIGTVKTLFPDVERAFGFANRIMQCSGRIYRTIGKYQWFCAETQEYIRIAEV